MTKKQGFWGMAWLIFLVSAITLVTSKNRDFRFRKRLEEGQRLARAICLASVEQGSFPDDGVSMGEALRHRTLDFDPELVASWQWMNNEGYPKCLFLSSPGGSDLFLFIKERGPGRFAVYGRAHDKMRPHKLGLCDIRRGRESDCVKSLPTLRFHFDVKDVQKRKLERILFSK